MGVLRLFRARDVATPRSPLALPEQAVPCDGRRASIDVVGEASYQDHIKRVARDAGGGTFPIMLVAEPQNRYDKKAVAVIAGGAHVGYLPKGMAAKWQPEVIAANRRGQVVTGEAEICGGDADRPHMGVFGEATWPGATDAPHRAKRSAR